MNTDANAIQTAANQKRNRAFDLARGLAITFMIIIHVIEVLANSRTQFSFYGLTVNSLTNLFSAPVFLFLMGVNLSFSRHHDPKYWVKRGIMIYFLGILLNLLRGTIPVYLGLQAEQFTLYDIEPFTPLMYLFEVDIFSCAGISLMILPLIKKLFKNSIFMIISALALIFITPLLGDPPISGFGPLDFILQTIYGNEYYVYFPLLPWISFSLLGVAFGMEFKKSNDQEKFNLRSVVLGCLLVLTGFMNNLLNDHVSLEDFLYGDFLQNIPPAGIMLILSGFVFLWITTCFIIVKKIPHNKVFQRFYTWSESVTAFYFIQWVLIGWISIFVAGLDLFFVIVLTVIIILLTDILVRVWKKAVAFFTSKSWME